MPWSDFFFRWLACSAVLTSVLLVLGGLAMLLCRQPTRRMRIIELTLAGCLIAPLLGMIPGYPQLNIGWPAMVDRHAATLPTDPPVIPIAEQKAAAVLHAMPRPAEHYAIQPEQSLAANPAPLTIAEPPEAPTRDWNVGSWLIGLYLLGVAAAIAWWLVGMAVLVRIVWTAAAAPPRCRNMLVEIAGRRGDKVRLLTSRAAKQPFASVGLAVQLPPQRGMWRRAVIVLPESLCNDDRAIRWALAHEWTHIEHGDFRAWFVAGLARVLFFYHPLVWWLRRQLRLCQDYVADSRASRQASQPADYAEFLAIRAAAGSLHPAMVGLGMGFSKGKSELYRRVVMLVTNPSLENRPPRLWSLSVTCVAMFLVTIVAGFTTSPLAVADGPAAFNDAQRPDASRPNPVEAGNTPSSFTAKLPSGVSVELLGVSNSANSRVWWRPDGSLLNKAPLDPTRNSVTGGAGTVVREFAVQWHNLPVDPIGKKYELVPPYSAYADIRSKRMGKDVAGLEGMIVCLPDQPTVTIRICVAGGPWQTVHESANGNEAVGLATGNSVAFSQIQEKDGNVFVAVAHSVKALQTRVVAVGKDGKEYCAILQSSNGAADFMVESAMFSKLSLADIRTFRLQRRLYRWVEFRNVSLQPGQITDVRISDVQSGNGLDRLVHPNPSAINTGGASGTLTAPDNAQRPDASRPNPVEAGNTQLKTSESSNTSSNKSSNTSKPPKASKNGRKPGGEMVVGVRPKGNCSISGKVASEATGKPIKNARVHLCYMTTVGSIFVNTDSDGNFQIKDIPKGPFLLCLSHTAGYQDVAYNPDGVPGPLPQFSLKDGEHRDGIVLKAKQACQVSGIIVDENGNVPENIGTLTVLAWSKDENGKTFKSDRARVKQTDGSYVIDGLGDKPVYVMAINWQTARAGNAYPPIYYPSTFSRKDAKLVTFVKSPKVEDVNIILRKTGGIIVEGAVLDEDGKPIPEAFVVAHRRDMLFDFVTAYTDEQGRYQIQGLGEGQFLVHVDAVHRGFVRTCESIDIDGENKKLHHSFTLQRGVLISGKFMDENGKEWQIGRSYGQAYSTNGQNNQFSLTQFWNKHRCQVVLDCQGGDFTVNEGDYDYAQMLFPTTSTFIIESMIPGETKLNFSPQKENQSVAKILYDGRDILESGIDTEPGQEIKDVTIVIKTRRVAASQKSAADSANAVPAGGAEKSGTSGPNTGGASGTRTGSIPSKPKTSVDQVIVEDLALEMLVAIREEKDDALKEMAVERIKGWRDALPKFALECRERFTQNTGKTFVMYPVESLVEGDLAVVRCARPKEISGDVCLVLYFVKTDDGWRNWMMRNSPPAKPLGDFLKEKPHK